MVDLQPLFVAIRGACSNKTWSTGIELSRGDAVDGIEASDEEVTLRVKVPGRTVAPTVTLYPEDDEWDCDCGSSGDCCEHVAAAILALRQARKEGKRLPSSAKAGGRIGYRLSPEGERLVVARVAVTGDEETPIDGSLAGLLSGRESGPAVEPDSVDLTIDRLMSMNRVRALSADTVQSLLPLLAEAQDVTFEGAPVKVLAQGLGPTAIVTAAKKGGFRLRLEAPASFERVILPGLALTRGDEGLALRPLELTDLAGLRFEALPLESVYPAGRVAELIGEVLPRLRQHGEVDLRTSELPDRVRHVEARIVIDVEQKGGALSVLPVLVYGDPPCARVDGDELVHLAGPVPRRDKRAEERALRGLREALDLVPGRRVEVMGKDAVSLAHKLRSFQGTIHGDAHRRLYPKKPLSAELALDPGDFSARFVSGGAEADPEEVLRAYQRGQSVVPLLGGGWAELPASWLEQHGHRLAEILAARDAQGTVAPHARPVMAELCDALERPRPPALQALAPLLDGFESLPEAKLPKDLRADLRPYQHEGVAWLSFLRKAGLGAVLADDMGLG
ncbi:MAG: SWIM zinc finger family protein, partial [Myxococcales bacterium]|nr:SWIM zinc finger family protein [Myxococcales bacterium]